MKCSQPQQWRREEVWSGDQRGQRWGRGNGWREGVGAYQLWGQRGKAGDFSGSAVGARELAGGYRGGCGMHFNKLNMLVYP